MDADELLDFLDHRMRMSHVYQPLQIRILLDAGGAATMRQLAVEFSAADEAQIRFYENRIKQMPLKVLRSHDVVTRDGDLVSLNTHALSFEQRAQLRAACERRIGDFLQARGLSAWDYSLLEISPVPETTRYEVLKRDRICQLCGVSRDEARLEVDHIVPRSKGGSNEPDNLQVLCGRCNRAKGNRDQTDFR